VGDQAVHRGHGRVGKTGDATGARILRPDDPGWRELLSLCDHDFYHSPGYVRLEAARLGGEPLAIVSGDTDGFVFLPVVIRDLVLGEGEAALRVKDAVSPYGYASPLLGGKLAVGNGQAPREIRGLLDVLRDLGCSSVLVRLHPLLPLPAGLLEEFGSVVTHGETVWIDLALPDEEIWRQVRKSSRSSINQLKRKGVTARIDEDGSRFDEFVDVYHQTMRHVQADDAYHFPKEYFLGLMEELRGQIFLCVAERDGELLAGGLFTECCGTVQYHLSGTAERHRELAPTRLLLDHARCWAKSRGNERFHLGGGVGGAEDSLFRFKTGFSKLRSTYSTWRVVLQPERYRHAVDRWERIAGRTACDPDSFFPAYREPLP
jgi:hypothetical protein